MFRGAHLRDEFHDDAPNPLSIGRFLKKDNIAAFRRDGRCHKGVGGQDDGWNSHFRIAPQIMNDGESDFAVAEPIVGDDEIRLA